jgi:DNA-binding IclR family transcriptional regulator
VNKSVNQKIPIIVDPITEKQAYALGVISVLIQTDARPTLEEIGGYLGVSRQSVDQLLAILERKGYITRNGTARSLRLTDKPLPYATQKKAA